MTLLVDEIYTGRTIVQNFKIHQNVSIYAIRPWFFKNGTCPNGTFELTILDGENVLATSTIDGADINSEITGTYAHGFIRFEFTNLVLHIPETETEKEYTMQFTFDAAFDGSNFIGLCKRYDDKTYDTYGIDVVNNEASNDSVEPYGLEIFEYTDRR